MLLQKIDELSETIENTPPPKQDGSAMNLAKAFDMAFTMLKDLQGDGQIFICTGNDDPCDKTLHKGSSEQAVRNYHVIYIFIYI